jgi:transposase
MMGQLPASQNALFYDFCLEKHIPEDHLLRQIDQFLDFDQIRQHLQPFYSTTGRPSIDPELMIRMLLVEAEVPDHSSFSKNRHGRFRDAGAFRYKQKCPIIRASPRTVMAASVMPGRSGMSLNKSWRAASMQTL